ncbi:MAG TPA: HslU--HslV peptidase proteolytic subunit, partial [bacterium]|nr:HslU--HslV peptidase proteolytic subunit [bacterium]
MSYLQTLHATTIIGLRHKGVAVLAGDGQVTYGDMVLK